jgi:hypothetical protein
MTSKPASVGSQEAAAPNEPFPFPTAERHDAPSADRPVTEEPTEEALDHGIEESFPASDPVSVSVTKAVPKRGEKEGKDEDGSQTV